MNTIVTTDGTAEGGCAPKSGATPAARAAAMRGRTGFRPHPLGRNADHPDNRTLAGGQP